MDNMTLSDIAAVTNRDKDNGFFNGDGFWGIIVLFFIFAMFGGGGMFGNGSLQGALTRGEMADSFNTAEILRNQNSLMRDQFGVQRDVLESRFAAQNCCCETQKEILQSRYDAALQAQATQAQMAACCCDTKTAIHAEGEATRALIQDNAIKALESQLQNMTNAYNNTQLAYNIINTVRPFPQPAYITCSPYQATNTCGYTNGFSNGCN